MIDEAVKWESGELRDALEYAIANHMKKSYLNWNRESVDDDVIYNHLKELSDGKINLKNSEEDLSEASSLLKGNKKYSNTPKKPASNRNPRGRKRY
jgi:hypothetical protein